MWCGMQWICRFLAQLLKKPLLNRSGRSWLVGLGLAASITVQVTPAQAQVSFLSAKSLPVGVIGEAAGDLDGDGDLDLVITQLTGYYDGRVLVLKNSGNGSFDPSQSVVVPIGHNVLPGELTLGDFDGDGDLDIATANFYTSGVSVIKNNGDGTFALAQTLEFGADSVVAGDLDGDGDLDLITGLSASQSYVSLLKNNGNGTFAPPVKLLIVPSAPYSPLSVALGDLDGDGDLDIAFAPGADQGSLSVLKNNGNATFAPPNQVTTGAYLESIVLADLDGDSDLDLAITGGNERRVVQVFKNNGLGSFGAVALFSTAGKVPNTLTAGDLDGDGDLDLVSTDRTDGTVSVLTNGGNATFTTSRSYAGAGNYLARAVLGDFDGDRALDVSVGASCSSSILFNRGGTLLAARNFATGGEASAVALGDLDSDGDLDVIAVDSTGLDTGISVLKNKGNGGLGAPRRYPSPSPSGLVSGFASGDFDGDGDLDLAVAEYFSGIIQVLSNNGKGTFVATANFNAGSAISSLSVGDLDSDGDLDLLAASRNDYISVFRNGGGTFGAPRRFSFYIDNGNDLANAQVVLGDIDGDGDLDLVAPQFNSNRLGILKNNGDGTFATNTTYLSVDGRPLGVVGADFDGDGDLDLAVTVTVSNGSIVSVLLNRGDGTFDAPAIFHTIDGNSSISAGDLDGDGDVDLVTSGRLANVSVLLNRGGGRFALEASLTPAADGVAIGDLDGDGDLDLTVARGGNNTSVAVLENITRRRTLSAAAHK